jgi:hypothetical protein
VPDEWLTLVRGNPQTHAGFDFCSEKCLAQWMYGNATQGESNTPECKARRFVMSDGTEGVKWKDGCVDLDTNSPHCLLQSDSRHCNGIFYSWNEFINHHFNCEITWIDQEQQA